MNQNLLQPECLLLCCILFVDFLKMKKEICAAVDFLTRLVGKNGQISDDQAEVFQHSLGTIMTEKFRDHWFPEKPCKGQAYRCIRVNGRERKDPILEQAAQMCGVKYENLRLPVELTVWVDPEEVCCRFGEDEGSYCTVASFKHNKENLSNNIMEENVFKSQILNQGSQDPSKMLKKSKKSLEKQKKSISFKNYIVSAPSSNSFHAKISSYSSWNPASVLSSRLTHQDLPFTRRPRKTVRSLYNSDRCQWVRK